MTVTMSDPTSAADAALQRLRALPQKVADLLNGTVITLPANATPPNPVADALKKAKEKKTDLAKVPHLEIDTTAPPGIDPYIFGETLEPVIQAAVAEALQS